MATITPAFPSPFPENRRSIRFYATGTTTGAFAGNQFAFERAGVTPSDQGWSTAIRVRAVAGDVEISFDGVNVHGFIPSGEAQVYWDRYEGGISIRTSAGTPTFYIEAW